MFEVTEKANEKIKEVLEQREDSPAVRVMLSEGG